MKKDIFLPNVAEFICMTTSRLPVNRRKPPK